MKKSDKYLIKEIVNAKLELSKLSKDIDRVKAISDYDRLREEEYDKLLYIRDCICRLLSNINSDIDLCHSLLIDNNKSKCLKIR